MSDVTILSPHEAQTKQMDEFASHLVDLAKHTLGNVEDASSCLMSATAFTLMEVMPPHLAICAMRSMVDALKERLAN